MNWRLHLTNQAIRDLQIIAGKPPLLAVWTRADQVDFYDLATGIHYGCRQISDPPADKNYLSEDWRLFLTHLVDLKHRACLPVVSARQTTIYATADGRRRLFREPRGRLTVLAGGKLRILETTETNSLAAVGFDRSQGLVALLDAKGRLSIYRQGLWRGEFDMGLRMDRLRTSSVAIARGGRLILLTDGGQIVMADANGAVLKRVDVHYEIRQIACSPDGGTVVTSDNQAGLIRVYSGADLAHSHQRFAQDLIATAQQIQLMADLPPISAAINALVAGQRGTVGFAMSGVICMTNVSQMARLPRPSPLF